MNARPAPQESNGSMGVAGVLAILGLLGAMVYQDEIIPKEPQEAVVLEKTYNIQVGEIAKLDASGEFDGPGEAFSWTVLPEGTKYEIDSNGKILYLSSGRPKTFDVVLATAQDCEAQSKSIKVIVGAGGGNPFYIGAKMPNKEVGLLVAEAWETATGNNITELKTNFQEKVLVIPGYVSEEWAYVFEQVNKTFDDLKREGKVVTVEDYKKLFKEVGAAFREGAGKI